MKTPQKRITVNPSRQEVFIIESGRAPREIYLAPSEWKIFVALREDDKVWTRKQLAGAMGVPADDLELYTVGRVIDQHIARTRRKLGAEVIRTVTKSGYKIGADFAA